MKKVILALIVSVMLLTSCGKTEEVNMIDKYRELYIDTIDGMKDESFENRYKAAAILYAEESVVCSVMGKKATTLESNPEDYEYSVEMNEAYGIRSIVITITYKPLNKTSYNCILARNEWGKS